MLLQTSQNRMDETKLVRRLWICLIQMCRSRQRDQYQARRLVLAIMPRSIPDSRIKNSTTHITSRKEVPLQLPVASELHPFNLHQPPIWNQLWKIRKIPGCRKTLKVGMVRFRETTFKLRCFVLTRKGRITHQIL